ncbi:MAG TPA: UTP--glucose-1-phosphate uridylyltransferase GalU [Acidimicrobiales bacterium]|nr:UTP--glucose-1-phosphate uridylyltransferase GalU [Acidimicrobiales bacterium]
MPSVVRKAVIPAAGLGTRFLPVTKSLPKEMLPIVDKPSIQYVVEEAARAGLRDVLLITSRGKTSLADYFDLAPELEEHLAASGKDEELESIQAIAELARVHYVRQREPKGLGHAVGVAREHVGNEPFAVLLGDDIMHERSGVLKGMLAAFERHRGSVVALKTVEPAEISFYGAARVEPVEPGVVRLREVVEKPQPEDAPSDLAVMGRYVFTPEIFDAIDRVKPGKGGELQLTDAIGLLLEEQPVYGYTFDWGRYDAGNKLDYLRANIELALERPELRAGLRRILNDLVARDEGL